MTMGETPASSSKLALLDGSLMLYPRRLVGAGRLTVPQVFSFSFRMETNRRFARLSH